MSAIFPSITHPRAGAHRATRARRAAVSMIALLIGCLSILTSQAGPAGADSYVLIQGEGSSWSANMINQWIADEQANGLRVDYNANGSTAGRIDFINGKTDFAASDIPFQTNPNDGSAPEHPATGSYAYMPVTAGGTVFMYNLQINGQRVTNLRLSGENITKIFTGAITNWDDPALATDNPGLKLPDQTIVPVVRSDGAGSSYELTEWMISQYPALWNSYCSKAGRAPACGATSFYPTVTGMLAKNGDLGVAGDVSQSYANGSIGYVEYSYAQNDQFPVVQMLNAAGYYTQPTAQNVAVSLLQDQVDTTDVNNPALYLTQKLQGVYTDPDPRTYPLSSYGYMILPTTVSSTNSFSTAKGHSLAKFAYDDMCQGQQQAAQLGYSPMPINLVEAGFQQIDKIPGASIETFSEATCKNPTFDLSGPNQLAATAPYPPACDKQGPTQCTTGTGGAAAVSTPVSAGSPEAQKGTAAVGSTSSSSGAGSSSSSGAAATGATSTATTTPCDPDHRFLLVNRFRWLVGRRSDRCHGDPGRVEGLVRRPVAAGGHRAPVAGHHPCSRPSGPTDGQAEAMISARNQRTGRRGRNRRRTQVATTVAVAAVMAVLAFVPGVQPGASATEAATAGAAGTDASLPTTDSAVNVHGQGTYAGLTIHVNQTRNLVNQAVSLSWTGGAPTFSDPTTGAFKSDFNGNYLQIFECWGDPQTVNPPNTADPGPLPTQCEFGGESSTPTSSYPISEIGQEYSRVLSEPSWSTYAGLQNQTIPGTDNVKTWTDSGTNGSGYVVEPFVGVDGTVINQQVNYNYLNNVFKPQPYGVNPDFGFGTTNEVDFARTYSDGTGQQLFQMDTGLEASGLGCGQDIQPVAGGTKTPQCWLVVVPRSTPAQENPAGLTGVQSVVTSPLSAEAWANRIAIPLEFNNVGSNCADSGNAEQLTGDEMASLAFSNWQTALCQLPGGTPYQYIQSNDALSRQNLTDPSYGSTGLSVFSDPIDASQTTSTNPPVYAPFTLSGVVVAFNIQRSPALESDGSLNPDEVPLAGSQVEHLYLTPRLVAKLLTESYQAQLENVTNDTQSGYSWALRNPTSLLTDPDFLQYNKEFSLLSTQQKIDAGTLLVEEGSSDAATALWKWVLSDKAARLWLSGTPDQWGMTVNPYYSTNADYNPSGSAFGTPTPNNFGKSDPYCYTDPTAVVYGPPQEPARPLCILDWSPYALSMKTAALAAGTANDGAKTTLDPTQTANTAWVANGPQKSGNAFVMTVTDSASAAQYGLQTASLSRSNDDGSNPTFVAPTTSSILAGEQAMVPSAAKGVLQDNPSTTAANAYPLPMLTYATTTPETLSTGDRQKYAALIQYAAGPGQNDGVQADSTSGGDQPGDLPPGYVPLPAALRSQALAAAATVLNPPAEPATTTPATPATSTGLTPTEPSDDSSVLASPDELTSPVTSTSATTEPTKTLPPVALATLHTHGIPIGVLRWMLPIVLLIGLLAGAAALLIGRTGQAAAAAVPPPGEPGGSDQ